MTRTPPHPAPVRTLQWSVRHEQALTAECRMSYCERPIGEPCVDQAGQELGSQPAHLVREQDAAAADGRVLDLSTEDIEPEPEPEPATVRRKGPAAKTRQACNYCGGRLLWARTRKDLPMPLDAEPSAKGNVLVTDEGGQLRADVIGRPRVAEAMRATGKPLHLHHAVECPYAHKWHKK